MDGGGGRGRWKCEEEGGENLRWMEEKGGGGRKKGGRDNKQRRKEHQFERKEESRGVARIFQFAEIC